MLSYMALPIGSKCKNLTQLEIPLPSPPLTIAVGILRRGILDDPGLNPLAKQK